MKSRCKDENVPCYPLYGGRGIDVCKEWCDSFATFRDWAMANGYTDNLTIDRKDNDKGYCPDNCRFATRHEQNRNTRSNRMITYGGETLCLTDMANKYGVNRGTLAARLNRGWTTEKALMQKKKK